MDKKLQEKFDDLNSYVQELEDKVKKGTKINIAIYGILSILFLIYAIYIPREVNRYTSPEEGPETLVSLIESSLPDDEEMLSHAKSEIPTAIADGLDQLWNMIPTGEQMIIDGMNGMTEQMLAVMNKEIGPDLTQYMVEQVAIIKEKNPDLSRQDAKNLFNEAARIHLRETLSKMVKEGKWEIMSYKVQLQKYRKPDNKMTAKEYAEKRVLLSFIRLGDDAEYRDQMAGLIVQAIENTYGNLMPK